MIRQFTGGPPTRAPSRLGRMTTTQQRTGAAAPSAWRRMRLWTVSHAVDDLYQGLVPSVVPYFVLDRHYGYVAASGLTLAATLGSALPQLVAGFVVDRHPV